MFYYTQKVGGEESWAAIPASRRKQFVEQYNPMFITVLSVSKLVDDLSYEEKIGLQYSGPMYFDWDSEDEGKVIDKVNQFLTTLEKKGVNLAMCRLFATGGRGYHLEIPQEVFMDKIKEGGVKGLPVIYKEVANELVVDTLDLRVYSAGKGRMWRMPNVRRPNGRYKVPITVTEMREMTPEMGQQITSAPRPEIKTLKPEYCVDFGMMYEAAAQKVAGLLEKRKKFKPDPKAKEKAGAESVQWLMAGLGVKDNVGFQQLATQLAIAAVTAGLSEEDFVRECDGLIRTHQSDGNRYNSERKRADELRRMYHYMDGNPCYEFSIGALKSIMSHAAPDLDGMMVTKAEVLEVIKEAEADKELDQEMDEYEDVARGITISRYGIYADSAESGKKRICALSFANAAVLRSSESCQIIGYESDVLVNGAVVGRQTLEVEVFETLVKFNRFASKYGHAFQGTDPQIRTVMMRFVEQAKKKGKTRYVVTREGLDMVSIPHHENELYHKPFLIWADSYSVVLPPHIAESGLEVTFAGYPNPHGVFKSDISRAPELSPWLKIEGNRELLRDMLKNLFTCQKADFLGKVIGWHVACFYKQLFIKAYLKFPLLHVNGAAGLGKTETILNIENLFYFEKEVRPLSPGSTPFAMIQHLTASASIPLVLDEYKPHAMKPELHERLKGMIRDAYNQRDVARGGGSRESDDYRILHESQMSGPMVFIAEAAEDEAAVMERVVLATITRPSAAVGLQWLARYQAYSRHKHLLGILGQYMAASIVHEGTLEAFQEEFDTLYTAMREKYMLSAKDMEGKLDEETLKNKQNAKERSVYNHTVAVFGFKQFRKLINTVLGKELDDIMEELEANIFARMSDLHAATTPEYIKVLGMMSSMSHSIDNMDRPDSLKHGREYALVDGGGQGQIELNMRIAYLRYRQFCRSVGIAPLYGNDISFMHAVKDSPAFRKVGTGQVLSMPGIYTFDVEELARLGVDGFSGRN